MEVNTTQIGLSIAKFIMKFLDKLKNTFLYKNKYKTNSEAVIVACYFNPQNNPYRLKAFGLWYESIKHLNHRIVECVIGDSTPELNTAFSSPSITTVRTPNLLWHKESLLNMVIADLPAKFKYVFWLDTDIIFINNNWLVKSVDMLQDNNILQPFEYCVHLNQDELTPNFDTSIEKPKLFIPSLRHSKMWRSFGSNHRLGFSNDKNYDKHGHVGFAWGARREVLDAVPLYDRALIGGADHIIAHAAAGQINHVCITKSFTENLDEIEKWSKRFSSVVKGKIGYVEGDLYHIWHGDLEKRQYLKRIQEFTPVANGITKKDKNGLHVTTDGADSNYMKQYFHQREVKKAYPTRSEAKKQLLIQYPDSDDSFIESMILGYMTDSTVMGTVLGGNLAGAMVGDMLNNNDQSVDFGGSWEPDNLIQSDSTQVDNIQSDNFS